MIQRYMLEKHPEHGVPVMMPRTHGRYMKWDDHAPVAEERDRLKAALDADEPEDEFRGRSELAVELAECKADLAHRQKCWTLLSQAISARSTEAIRDTYKGNTPEWINAETDELTVIFGEFADLRTRIDDLGLSRDKVYESRQKLRAERDRLRAEVERLEGEAEAHTDALLRAIGRGVDKVARAEQRRANWAEAFDAAQAELSALRAEVERLKARAHEAEKLVAPATNYSGVPDRTQGPEWNAGYRHRQREEWSRALNAENKLREHSSELSALRELAAEAAELEAVLCNGRFETEVPGEFARFAQARANNRAALARWREVTGG